MRVILVTGGARSGKSHYAQERALALGGDDVLFIATAQESDPEMRDRIARHRAERPDAWRTLETPRDAGTAVAAANAGVVLLDCLTLLASNVLLANAAAGAEAARAAVRAEAEVLLAAAAGRDGTLIVVTNEVGLGIVPDNPLARSYRDALGEANQALGRAADEVVFMVSGLPVQLR